MFTQSTHPQYLMPMRDLIATCSMSERTVYPRHWAKWLVSDDPDRLRPDISQTNPLNILNPIDIWLCVAILIPAELTAIRFLALNHFMIHGYVIQFLGMFFGAFLQWMSGFGLVACACSVVDLRIMLDEHPITARKSSNFTFGWEKKGKDPMFVQVLDSFIVCYITRIYHPGENPSCLHCLGMFVEYSWVNSRCISTGWVVTKTHCLICGQKHGVTYIPCVPLTLIHLQLRSTKPPCSQKSHEIARWISLAWIKSTKTSPEIPWMPRLRLAFVLPTWGTSPGHSTFRWDTKMGSDPRGADVSLEMNVTKSKNKVGDDVDMKEIGWYHMQEKDGGVFEAIA